MQYELVVLSSLRKKIQRSLCSILNIQIWKEPFWKRRCSEFTERLIIRVNLQEKQHLCIFQDIELIQVRLNLSTDLPSSLLPRHIKISSREWKLIELYGVCHFIKISPSEKLACRSLYVHIAKRPKINLVFLTVPFFSSCNRQIAKEFWKKNNYMPLTWKIHTDNC